MAQEKETLKEATTKQALVLIGWYHLCVLKNIAKAIDKFVCKHPWVCMIATIIVAFIISFVFISKARAERDSYNKTLVHTQMELSTYKACYDNEKEVK